MTAASDPTADWIASGNPRHKRPAGVRSVWDEAHAERVRAHAKHGETSMESQPADALDRLFILVEEVAEVAGEFLQAHVRHGGPLDNRDHIVSALRSVVLAGRNARRLNDARHLGLEPLPTMSKVDLDAVRKELIQVTAMAAAWAAATPNGTSDG